MCEAVDNNLIEHVFCRDPTILEEIKSHRSGDVHRLLRRLDAAKKESLKNLGTWTVSQVHTLLDVLVKCYIDTADSIKLSRAVEKLWQPYLKGHQEYLHSCLEGCVMSVINTSGVDFLQIAKVSALLEQNQVVQEIFRKNLTKVTLWLSSELSPLLKPSPDSLTSSQAQCLHALVKISLQLFQVCADEFGEQIWGVSDHQSHMNQSVISVVKSLVYILHTQGYQTDCLLLSGTATALMFNCCKDTELAVNSFTKLLYKVLNTDSAYTVDFLRQDKSVDIDEQKYIFDNLSSLTLTRLGPVSLIRGIVACGRADILFAVSQDCAGDSKILYHQLYQYISILCHGDITLHYQAFQILLLWFTKLTKSTSNMEKSSLTSILESTLDLVVLNWDSPVEDVPEAVVEIFTCMMTVWQTLKDVIPDFPSKILESLVRTQWYVKGRYRILAVLLNYIDPVEILKRTPEIETQLLLCLTTNHLASSATNVYKSFLTQLQRGTDGTENWKASWLPALIEGLVSDNSLVRYNTSLHWTPVTFKLLPDTSDTVQDHLSAAMKDPNHPVDRVRLLHAWIIVAKTVRLQTGYTNLDHINVREALCCADEDVRSDAISLVCTTLKKAEYISSNEVSILMECIPYNIKLDSAPFRQHLGSDIRKLLVRLRDSCTTLLKSSSQNKEKLDCALDFVDWLHKLCIGYLLPGASYQRRKGSLDLLHVIYESLIYCERNKQRKGFVPESARKLVQFAMSSGRLDFFNKVNTQALILCLLDGAEEIQMSAYLLLIRYYTLTVDVKTQQSLCCHLLSESLRLCNSPKGHEGQSGAILCKLVFQKCVANSKNKFIIDKNGHSNSTDIEVSVIQDGTVNSAVVFLDMLLSEAKRFMMEAEKDLVKASKHYPIHGVISAIRQCLTDIDDIKMISSDDLVSVSVQLVELCQQIIEKMLNIMAGVAGQEACPSFAEIGMALENLLSENQTDYEETTSLSPEYQYMLSWCWNNIKESCTSLGDVTRVTISLKNPMPVSIIISIKSTFHTVLTKCRHKGVIEGCRSAYVKFCSALFLSNQPEVLSIPENALKEVLTCLKQKRISSSVTRRSAGLPIIIQAVLVSEKKMKKAFLLCEAVKSLFEVCEIPLEKDVGLTDLPQVHGLNILNSLFSDASLTASLIGHTGHAVILVIQQFGSPSWAVRNAATRFFSTLVTKIFGQKKSHGDKFCNSVTFKEFNSYYPDLPPFMLEILNEAAKGNIMDISQIHPGLFPVLTLLSCLKPMEAQDQDILSQLQVFSILMQPFTGSPVYQLRHLVASALVAMVPVQEMTSSVILCLNKNVTQAQSSSSICNNSLHGHLLYILGLLDFIERFEDQERLWNLLTRESWLISVNNGMISSIYVKILHHILLACPSITCDEILEFVIVEHCTRGSKQIIGNSVYCEAAVEFLFESYNRNGLCMYGLVDKILTFKNMEARKSCLEKLPKFLQKPGKNHSYNKMAVMAVLCNCIKKEGELFTCTMLNLITEIYQDIGTIHKDDLQNLKDWFSDVEKKELKCGESFLVSVIPVQAIILKHNIETEDDNHRLAVPDLTIFCEDVNRFSSAVNENQRFSAVRALQIVGKQLLNQASTGSCSSWLISLLEAILKLVQDEDTDIRSETCKFISDLDWEGKSSQFSSYHSNVCFELFLRYLCDNFWDNEQCLKFLYTQLTLVISLQTLLIERESSRYQQLFDQEDNSFFAEKLYNAFDIYKHLKKAVNRCLNGKKTDILTTLTNTLSFDKIVKELEYLMSVLKSIHKGTVISICSDTLVLSSISTFLLSCDIVALVTNNQTIQETLGNVVMDAAFPPLLRQKFLDIDVNVFSSS